MKKEYTKHGHASSNNGSKKRSREYTAWIDMRSRCKYPNRPGYHNYGGRGIKVCDRWQISFINFLKDVGSAPSSNHELDRKNVNGDYKPGNVHWVTHRQNSRNMRKTTWVIFRGKRKSLQQWCEELGLKRRTVARRLQNGVSPNEAFRW
jgi:hypothetical protein